MRQGTQTTQPSRTLQGLAEEQRNVDLRLYLESTEESDTEVWFFETGSHY